MRLYQVNIKQILGHISKREGNLRNAEKHVSKTKVLQLRGELWGGGKLGLMQNVPDMCR